ncbi:hypothetical protein [Mesorhizobium sp. CN2-181]|uniref:hypothetical protein n=1 Tax=Mesorhizobium yinganensis TaxID=3157707 RepID=UPI0032B712BD
MVGKNEDPGALAGAQRVDVTMLAGNDDTTDFSPTTIDLQVRTLLLRYAMSVPMAMVVAELAFFGRSA